MSPLPPSLFASLFLAADILLPSFYSNSTETLIDQEGPYVAQTKSPRVAGEAAKPEDGRKKGPPRRGVGHGSLEKMMGSLNVSNETKHSGTCKFQSLRP